VKCYFKIKFVIYEHLHTTDGSNALSHSSNRTTSCACCWGIIYCTACVSTMPCQYHIMNSHLRTVCG